MKNTFLLSLLLVLVTTFTFSQESNYQLSSHILDITQGQPAIGVKISLSKQDNSGKWKSIDEKQTDKNGRINDFLKIKKGVNHQGIYKLTYYTAHYFKLLGQESFYPFIEVVFELKDNNHYHVPITLSAFGYSTYRGN
ncbi:hydroxyisourate hydrolase [Tenacibaculum dicentrarchi]|uniref:hydroxyisourate hydrolase n=1 Tax=Tenacibaculum dicentrarchi TaxID=669041 RepID=UPI001BEBDD54|nr:hydroxyisourate hydrolase [Tenacibaculum dicentrarchi]MCD8408465.1 hydroxyisourate hydrolase [Tenacibaculum dicentrarchi]MCD8415755.1 hydroxyisourate hydrolase [Tenacibaculum dicentrarchi]MCD8420879.1 hydroxyisourate hydrolase [Tenacibaculum dicentrarchi]MCD8438049.1 hydroxyisourate hydrolase [Tenacibaculum dicentrarchi]